MFKVSINKLCILIACLALASCGERKVLDSTTNTYFIVEAKDNITGQQQEIYEVKTPASQIQRHGDYYIPPPEYYEYLRDQYQNASFSLTNTTQVLYIHFDGGRIPKGSGPGASEIICKSSVNIPNSNIGPARRQTIRQLVQQDFDVAGVAIDVTITRPSSGPFTTIVVGGRASMLGCEDTQNSDADILGEAPLDVGNLNKSDTGFAYLNGQHGSDAELSQTISHEAGHSFGLRHIETANAMMFFSSTSSTSLAFGSGKVKDVNMNQDSVAILKKVVGTKGATTQPSPTTEGDQAKPQSPTTSTDPNVASTPTVPTATGFTDFFTDFFNGFSSSTSSTSSTSTAGTPAPQSTDFGGLFQSFFSTFGAPASTASTTTTPDTSKAVGRTTSDTKTDTDIDTGTNSFQNDSGAEFFDSFAH